MNTVPVILASSTSHSLRLSSPLRSRQQVKAAADLREAAIKKEVKAAEGVVAKAQANLDASILVSHRPLCLLL